MCVTSSSILLTEALLRGDGGQPAQEVPAEQIHEHVVILTDVQDRGGEDGHSFLLHTQIGFTELQHVCEDDRATTHVSTVWSVYFV